MEYYLLTKFSFRFINFELQLLPFLIQGFIFGDSISLESNSIMLKERSGIIQYRIMGKCWWIWNESGLFWNILWFKDAEKYQELIIGWWKKYLFNINNINVGVSGSGKNTKKLIGESFNQSYSWNVHNASQALVPLSK